MAPNPRWMDLTRRVAALEWPDNPEMQELYFRLIQQESSFSDDVVLGQRRSSAGAQGIAQFMPQTAAGEGVDPFNPEQALHGGARYLKKQIAYFGGDVAKGVAAYNTGAGNVQNAVARGGANWAAALPADETRHYLDVIIGGRSLPQQSGQQTSTGGGGGRRVTQQSRYQSPYTAQKQALQAQLDDIAAQLADPNLDSADAYILQKQQAEITSSLYNITRVERSEAGKEGGAGEITNWYGSIWNMLEGAFQNDMGTAKLMYDLIVGNRSDYITELESQVAAGKLDFDSAVKEVELQGQRQAMQLAYAVEGLSYAKFIADENRKNAMMALPQGTRYQAQFYPGSAINVAMQNLGLPPMIIEVTNVPKEMLDPMRAITQARTAMEGMGATAPDLDLSGVTAARTRLQNLPTYTSKPITAQDIGGIPRGPDPSRILAAMFSERDELNAPVEEGLETGGGLPTGVVPVQFPRRSMGGGGGSGQGALTP